MRKLIFFLGVAITATALFTSCNNKGNEPTPPAIKEVASIELNKTTLLLEVGKSETLTATVKPDDAADKTVTWTSSNSEVATVENGRVTAVSVGSAVITAKAGDKTATCAVTVFDPLTDKGVVIKGVKWATRNVDAVGTFAATPESAGMFYQWNRKVAWNATDEYVAGWDDTDDPGTKWTAENDPCPAGWRVPNRAELETLTKVTFEWTTENSINGMRFTDTNGNSIFLPAAGYRHRSDGTLNNRGIVGYYWSTTVVNTDLAYYLDFSSSTNLTDYYYKSRGFSVRCVCEQ